MTLAVAFRPAARAEFLAAAARYESQRPSLGAQFLAEIERCIALAAEQPNTYAVVRKNARRVTARRFPYSIYFQAEPHALSYWRCSMEAVILRSGGAGPNKCFEPTRAKPRAAQT
jgi:hypothetical protein